MAGERIDGNADLLEKVKGDLEPVNKLGIEFLRQFREAAMTKRTIRVGDYSLEQLLRECYNARDDKSSEKEMALLKKYPSWSSMPVSLVSYKVNMLVSMIRESLADISNAPFIVEPTPNPEIPESVREQIMQETENEIITVAQAVVQAQQAFVQGAVENGRDANEAAQSDLMERLNSKEVYDFIRQQKIKAHRMVKEHAKDEAARLEEELYDKTTEGGYGKAIIEFADDFATYPFACMHGPFPTIKQETRWKKDKFVEESKVVWAFERVSPFDLFWTADSLNTQNGAAVFIRKRVGFRYLYECRDLAKKSNPSGYRLDNIEYLLDCTKEGRIPRNWVDVFDGNVEYKDLRMSWMMGDTVDIIIRYGQFHGFELKDMEFEGIDEDKLYETKSIMCGGQIINCEINKNPSQYKRPVFTASFESRNNSIVGVGLGQKLLSLHYAYRAVTATAMYNFGLSSQPITEMEIDRIAGELPEEFNENPGVQGGQVFAVRSDRVNSGARAIKFTEIPNITQQALQLAEYIKELAHEISNIPAALHGQPVGTGANRTVRGLLTLQGNTLKPIQSSLTNLDNGVIQPMVTLLYILLVMYDDDFEYAGDCKIVAKGAASMVEREIDKQNAMENLQIIGQLANNVDPEILQRVIEKVLTLAGILEPGEHVDGQALLAQVQQQAQTQQQGIPGQAPVEQAPAQPQPTENQPTT